jgi:TrmH family RNA methyltransferase
MLPKIDNKENKKFKLLKKLTTKKGRSSLKMFLAEGKKFLAYNPKYVFSLEEGLEGAYFISKSLFEDVSSLTNSEGVISVFDIQDCNISEISGDAVILDRVQNPDNLGAIMRNMVAFGFNNLILIKGCCDPYNMKSVRSSMGSIFDLNIYHIDYKDLNTIANKYSILSADASGSDINEEMNLLSRRPIALVFGNESRGISNDILKISKSISIRINEKLDSLNVAVASGIMLYVLNKTLEK